MQKRVGRTRSADFSPPLTSRLKSALLFWDKLLLLIILTACGSATSIPEPIQTAVISPTLAPAAGHLSAQEGTQRQHGRPSGGSQRIGGADLLLRRHIWENGIFGAEEDPADAELQGGRRVEQPDMICILDQ